MVGGHWRCPLPKELAPCLMFCSCGYVVSLPAASDKSDTSGKAWAAFEIPKSLGEECLKE